jgi:hypothetical protein
MELFGSVGLMLFFPGLGIAMKAHTDTPRFSLEPVYRSGVIVPKLFDSRPRQQLVDREIYTPIVPCCLVPTVSRPPFPFLEPTDPETWLLWLCSDDGDTFGKALGDAASLVDSYKGSTLWRRLWSGRRMATQLRDMQDVVDSYCGLVLFVNAHLLLQEAARHPSSPDTSTTTYVRAMQITTSLPKLKTYTF